LSQPATPDEEDVLVQVEAVSSALSELGHEAVAISFSLDLRKSLASLGDLRPEMLFNLVEGLDGSGRLIHLAPSLLDHLGIPYTGSSAEAIFLTSNKPIAKTWMQASKIPTPPWYSGRPGEARLPFSPGQYIVKSVWEHASVGIEEDSVVEVGDWPELCRQMSRRRGILGGDCFAEAYIEGREFNLSMLAGPSGMKVLPAAEIRFDDYPRHRTRLVGYRAKWDAESFEYAHTPRSFQFAEADAPLICRLKRIASRCWEAFGLNGYARVDFRVDPVGNPWVLEVNANPCLSPDAGFFAAAAESGLSYPQMIRRILEACPAPDGVPGE